MAVTYEMTLTLFAAWLGQLDGREEAVRALHSVGLAGLNATGGTVALHLGRIKRERDQLGVLLHL